MRFRRSAFDTQPLIGPILLARFRTVAFLIYRKYSTSSSVMALKVTPDGAALASNTLEKTPVNIGSSE